jgi:uncharacterized protein (TIGR03083 family)
MSQYDIAGVAIPDYGQAYAGVRTRTAALVRTASDAQLDAVAPATPEWRVRDVLAHMAGVPTDVLAGRMEGIASDAWTEAQVERYRGVPLEQVLAEWEEASATVEPMIPDFGVMAGQAIADVVTHEHDIRHALGAIEARDSDAVLIGSAWCSQWVAKRSAEDGPGTLRVETDLWSHTYGDDEPALVLRTSAFELLRAATGRRSTEQITAFDWSGEPQPHLVPLAIFHARSEDFDG